MRPMFEEDHASTPAFLAGGGEMGALMRAHDWSDSPLGPPQLWPQSLRSVVGLMLSSKFPMFVAWGKDLGFLYNDPYIEVLGGKHPRALGRRFYDIWSEIWPDISPLIDVAMAGEATYRENLPLLMNRNGQDEQTWFTFSYSPVRDESGAVAGMFCACTETTATIVSQQRLASHSERQFRMFEQAPGLICTLSGPDHVFEFANSAYQRLVDRPVVGRSVREAFPDLEGQGFFELLDQVYATGERFIADQVPIQFRSAEGGETEERLLDFIYAPILDEQDRVSGIFVEGSDVTARARAEAALAEREAQLRLITDSLPVLVSYVDAQGRYRFVNKAYEDWFGIFRDRIVGQPIRSILGEDAYAGVAPLIDRVLAGETLTAERQMAYPQGNRHIHIDYVPALDRDQVIGFYALVRDMTETRAAEEALRRSEERYRSLFESLDAGFCIFEMEYDEAGRAKDYRFVEVNPAFELQTGLADAQGKRMRELRPDHEQHWFDIYGEIARTGQARRFEQHAGALDQRWFDVHAFRIGDPEQNRVAVLFYDITDQKAVAERLRANEERLRLAADNAEVGFWDVDEVNDRLHWSRHVKAMFGISPDVPVSMDDFYSGLHPEDRDHTAHAYAAAADPAQRAMYDVEYRTVGKEDGVVRWVAAKGRGVFDEEGQCLRVAGTAIDISPRRQAEQRNLALIELTDRFRDLEEPGDLAFAASEILGRTLGVSRAGYGHVDPVAETITIERDWNAAGIASLAGTLQFRDYGSYIEDLKRGETVVFADAEKDSRTITTAAALKGISAQAVVNVPVTERGGVVGLLYLNHASAREWRPEELALVREVAERTRSAIARRQAEDEVRELAASLERKVEERTSELMLAQEALRQSQKLEAMGQLTGGVAHDFNNLLTPIIGSLDLLHRRGTGDQRQQRLIDGALQSAERAKTLVQRLLAFARRQPLQPRAVDVGALVEGMADLIASTSGPRTKVAVAVAPDVPAAVADPNQLEMAILNLSVNARDAMPDGGRLSIIVGSEQIAAGHPSGLVPGRYVCVSVADTGVGMDADTIARAIEPFFSTKGLGKGTGLGLSMVHGLVTQLGGTLQLSSRPGLGTEVELWLPATELQVTVDGGTAAPAAPVATGRALLVDDEELVRASTAHMLAELGYDVVETDSAEEALRRINAGERFDLLVTDHLMPGMTGTELARAAINRRADLPVLVISGYAELDGIAPDLPRLTKPFRQAELAEALSALAA